MKRDEKGNIGNRNAGSQNYGDQNYGNHNVGDKNIGHLNYGDKNIGDQNFGFHNLGHNNSGQHNHGDRNFGYYNRGDQNTGHYNYTDRAFGCFNTKPTSEYRWFNKPTNRLLLRDDLPAVLHHLELTSWIAEEDMTEKEKSRHPSYETRGGYLRRNDYKEAFRKAWNEATEDERREVLDLPNWDNEIFKEITGIDVENELKNQSQPNKEE